MLFFHTGNSLKAASVLNKGIKHGAAPEGCVHALGMDTLTHQHHALTVNTSR